MPKQEERSRAYAPDGGYVEEPRERAGEFEDLYRGWYGVVWVAARGRLSCDVDADTAAQRVFARLLRRGPAAWQIVRRENFFSCAGRNEALTLLRQQRRLEPLEPDLAATLKSPGPQPDDEVARKELHSILLRAIANLPSRCRRVMSLVYFESLTHREIAEQLGVTIEAVEKQVTRGRRLLKADLQAILDALR